jgi:hypothetical protein
MAISQKSEDVLRPCLSIIVTRHMGAIAIGSTRQMGAIRWRTSLAVTKMCDPHPSLRAVSYLTLPPPAHLSTEARERDGWDARGPW